MGILVSGALFPFICYPLWGQVSFKEIAVPRA
jgi:hypothetical protein